MFDAAAGASASTGLCRRWLFRSCTCHGSTSSHASLTGIGSTFILGAPWSPHVAALPVAAFTISTVTAGKELASRCSISSDIAATCSFQHCCRSVSTINPIARAVTCAITSWLPTSFFSAQQSWQRAGFDKSIAPEDADSFSSALTESTVASRLTYSITDTVSGKLVSCCISRHQDAIAAGDAGDATSQCFSASRKLGPSKPQASIFSKKS